TDTANWASQSSCGYDTARPRAQLVGDAVRRRHGGPDNQTAPIPGPCPWAPGTTVSSAIAADRAGALPVGQGRPPGHRRD
ncbi:MAG: hypothetical protein ACK56F_14560, partial [bacterium]